MAHCITSVYRCDSAADAEDCKGLSKNALFFASSLSTSAVQASIYGCFVIRSNLYFLSFLSSVRVCLLNANQLVYRCL